METENHVSPFSEGFHNGQHFLVSNAIAFLWRSHFSAEEGNWMKLLFVGSGIGDVLREDSRDGKV